MPGGLAPGLERIFQTEFPNVLQQAFFELDDVGPAIFFGIGNERNQIGGRLVSLGELAAYVLELFGDAESKGKRPLGAGNGEKRRKSFVPVEQALGQQGEDEGVGCGFRRKRNQVFRGHDGAGEDGGPLFGSDFGQFGPETASGMAGGDQNQGVAKVQRPLMTVLSPFLGQNADGRRQRGDFPPMKVPGDCHNG